MKTVLALFLALTFTATLQASGYKGNLQFSSQEVQKHKSSINRFLNVAKNCLQSYKKRHQDFFRSHCRTNSKGKKVCLSKFFGDRRYSKRKNAKRSDGKRLTYLPTALKKNGFNPALVKQMENTSCIGMAMSCLGQGFNQTGQGATWKKLKSFVHKNGTGGTALQSGLRKLGWKVFFWNPEPLSSINETTKKWDAEEKNWKSKGWHNYRYLTVRNSNRYWRNTVDDRYTMVGFEKGAPSILSNVPFWVGVAHTGYHVFPGTYKSVIEAHSTRSITSYHNLEFSTFAPMNQKGGGGPRWTPKEKYRSGMIALPPGY